MWPKDVPPPKPPRERPREPRLAPPPEMVLWTMRRFEQVATCRTRKHGSTMATRLVIDGSDIWRAYVPHADLSVRTEALRAQLSKDGWVLVADDPSSFAG